MSSQPANDQAAEEWRHVAGAPRYEVSNLGRVRGPRAILKPRPTDDGYVKAMVTTDDGRRVGKYVHGLVAAAFIGPRPRGREVDHIDFNTANNRASNLQYLTRKQNIRRAYAAGRPRAKNPLRGEKATWAKLTNAGALAVVRMRLAGTKQEDVAELFCISPASVSNIMTGKTWSSVTGRTYARSFPFHKRPATSLPHLLTPPAASKPAEKGVAV